MPYIVKTFGIFRATLQLHLLIPTTYTSSPRVRIPEMPHGLNLPLLSLPPPLWRSNQQSPPPSSDDTDSEPDVPPLPRSTPIDIPLNAQWEIRVRWHCTFCTFINFGDRTTGLIPQTCRLCDKRPTANQIKACP